MENIKEYVKRNASGEVDVDETMKDIRQLVEAEASKVKSNMDSDRKAVHAVFDKNKGENLPLGAVASYAAIQILKTDIHDFVATQERITNFIRNNKDEFEIARGPYGGVRRLSDEPKATAAE